MVICPLCNSEIDITKFDTLSLSSEDLRLLADHTENRTLSKLLRIGEIAWQRLDPEKTDVEFQVTNSISKMKEACVGWINDVKLLINELSKADENERKRMISDLLERIKRIENDQRENKQNVQDIKFKIIGNGIGTVTEKIVIKDLKQAVPTDSFSDERASLHGTDAIGTVKDKGRDCGRISVSVKNRQKWESKFITDLVYNMKEDGTKLGILATSTFPGEALHDKIYVPPEPIEGNTVVLVKLEYVSLAYIALREVAIHLFETRQMLQRKDEAVDEVYETFNRMISYINGEEFQIGIRKIDEAKKSAQDTRSKLTSIKNDIDKAIRLQNSIEENLGGAMDLVGKLRSILNDISSDTSSCTRERCGVR